MTKKVEKKTAAKPPKKGPAQASSPKAGKKLPAETAITAAAAATPTLGPDGNPLPIDPDQQEALEEQMEAQAAGANAGLGMEDESAAKAAQGAEVSTSLKNFRHHPDMENFYRFIYENDLRFEALEIIDKILAEKQARRKLKLTKAMAH